MIQRRQKLHGDGVSEEARAEVAVTYERIMSESRLKSGAAKEGMALALVTALEQVARLRAQIRSGDLASDEARSFPGLLGKVASLYEKLGMLEVVEDEEDAL